MLCGTVVIGSCSDDPTVQYALENEEYWQDTSDRPAFTSDRLLVTNSLDDTLSVLDAATWQEIDRVPVGLNPVDREGPHHVSADPDGEFYYVGISNFVPNAGGGPHGAHGAGTIDGHCLKFGASDNLLVQSVRVDRNPGDVAVTPDGATIVQSHFDLVRIREVIDRGGEPSELDSRLAIIDAGSMRRRAMVPTCPASHGIAIAPDGLQVFVSCYTDELAIVDLNDAPSLAQRVAVVGEPGPITAPVCLPYALTVDPRGESVWVSCFQNGQLLRYDITSSAMDPAVVLQLPGPALFGAFGPDGTTLYVPYQEIDGVAVVDTRTAMIVDDIDLEPDACINAHVVRITEDGAHLLVICEDNRIDPGTLVVIRLADNSVVQVTELGRFPDAIELLKFPR